MPSEPAAASQERIAPEGTIRAASPEFQEIEEDTSTSSSVTQTLEISCTPWAATSKSGDDAEDDEEVAACNTQERGLKWVRCTFDELILPATSVSFFA
jgi:hypothetical protein